MPMTVNGFDFDPTLGLGVDAVYIEGRMEMAAVHPLHHSLVRQRMTLDNASISAGRKRTIEEKISKHYAKQMKVMNKRLGVLSKISSKTKEQIEEEGRLTQQLEVLQKQIKSEVETAQKSDRTINSLKADNNMLNTINHASSSVVFALSPRFGNYLNLVVQETDKLSEDIESSASAGTSPAGLLMGQYNPFGALSALPGFIPGFHRFN